MITLDESLTIALVAGLCVAVGLFLAMRQPTLRRLTRWGRAPHRRRDVGRRPSRKPRRAA